MASGVVTSNERAEHMAPQSTGGREGGREGDKEGGRAGKRAVQAVPTDSLLRQPETVSARLGLGFS